MDCFWCEVIEGNLRLVEADEAKWLRRDELDSVQWLPADKEFVNESANVYNRRYDYGNVW